MRRTQLAHDMSLAAILDPMGSECSQVGLVARAPHIFDMGAGDRDGVEVSEVGAEDARDTPDVPDAQAVRDLDAVLGKAATWTRTLLLER